MADRSQALRSALSPQLPAGTDPARHCVDCGDEIPEGRRNAMRDRGVTTCTDCQSARERRGR